MKDVKKFLGIWNSDDKPENIDIGQHIDSLNIRFYGGANGLTAENIPGNTLISNATLPSGTNECIGACYDPIHRRIYWLNCNSNLRNGIYFLDINTLTVSELLVSFTDSQTDIFGFDIDYPATDMHIIYTTDVDGDILDFNTRNKRPKTLNIKQAENNFYGVNWLESYLDVAKEPFPTPPAVAFENDATATVNNLRNKLHRFKSRGWFAGNEKTTWGTISEVAVPFLYTDPQIDTDPTKNCRIGIVVQTGDASVRKIEIAGQENLKDVWGNFFSVVILDKDELGIPDNDVYIYRFYNSEAYVFIDLDESLLQFDRVPDRANAQELLNGNVRIYGGITEGLDPVVPDVTMGTDTEYPLAIDCNNILSVTQYGKLGFQTGHNIKFIVLGTIRVGQTFVAAVLVGATTFTITYTSILGDDAADVLVGLSASATGQGFTQDSITADTLVISRANQILLRHNISTTNQSISGTFVINSSTNVVRYNGGAASISLFFKDVQFILYGNLLNVNPFTVVSSVVVGSDLDITVKATLANETFTGLLYFVNPINNSIPAYSSSSKENWGLMYFDEKGKTNGVTTSEDFNVTTKYLGLSKSVNSLLFLTPYVTASIRHRPPLWAKTYQWVRTRNLTKQAYLSWVTSGTYQDEKYAYISIESINAYKRLNPNSVISYDFLPGDRISFYVLYNIDGTPNTVYTQGTIHDYEIYSQETNPDINGIVRSGQFLKLILPTTSSTFNFGDGITLEYNNYYVEIYTPAKSASEGLDEYYEFSEEYEVIDAGLSTRCHQGQLQNQSTNLATPATFKFNKGDAWYRTRAIDIGNVLRYDIVAGEYNFNNSTQPKPNYILGQKLTAQAYSTTDYVAAPEVIGIIAGTGNINSQNPNWTINGVNNTYTFNVTGVVNITMVSLYAGNLELRLGVVGPGSGSTYTLDTAVAPQTAGEQIAFNIDQTIVLLPGQRIYLYINPINNGTPLRFNVVSGFVNYTEPKKQFEVGVIDENFSDFFASKVNSNGRADTVHPDEKTNFFSTLLRWGLAYQQNTNINQVNRFFPNDRNEIDRSKGSIQRLKTRDRILRVFQNRAVGQFGVYASFISNADGNSQLITVNEILTKNNINYYQGEHGLGDQYSSLVSYVNSDYFPDIVTGDHMRLGADGFTNLSSLYKGQYYLRNKIVPYNKPYVRSNGKLSKILGCYYPFDEQWIPVLQGGTYNGNTIEDFTYSFGERQNGFNSPFSFHPEWILNAEDLIYSWKDGGIYIHNNTTNYCQFYGEQFDASITLVFNVNLIEVKSWESVTEVASSIWECPLIYTSVKSYSGQRQESELINVDFADLEGQFKSAFLRDIYSQGGLINGDWLKGSYIAIKFQISNAYNLVTLSEVSVMFKDSPLNTK